MCKWSHTWQNEREKGKKKKKTEERLVKSP